MISQVFPNPQFLISQNLYCSIPQLILFSAFKWMQMPLFIETNQAGNLQTTYK